MSRFRSRRETKAPMMRTANVRRTVQPDSPGDDSESPESEDALLNPPTEPTSSEPDSRAESTGIHDITVVNHPSGVGGPNVSAVRDNSIRPAGSTGGGDVDMTDATEGETTGDESNGSPSVKADSNSPAEIAARAGGSGHAPDKGAAASDANNSRDSGQSEGFEDDVDVAGFASVSIIEEQVKSNFPKTARPPCLVDCNMVSYIDV